jgi:hypothetical protein
MTNMHQEVANQYFNFQFYVSQLLYFLCHWYGGGIGNEPLNLNMICMQYGCLQIGRC